MRFPCDFDRGTPRRIAQTHKSEVEVQCVDQHVDKPGGDGARFSAGPHSRDGRDSHEVSDRSSQPQRVSLETHRHWARLLRSWGPPSLPEFEQKLVRWNEERILLPGVERRRVRGQLVDHQ